MDISTIVAGIHTAASAYENSAHGAREKLLDLSRSLIVALETPSEAIQKIGWAEPARTAAMRSAVDLGIFERLKDAEGLGLSSRNIAEDLGGGIDLIARMLKHLAAMNIIAEKGVDSYCSTALSNALTLPEYRDGIIYTHDVAGPSFHKLPIYLKRTGYKTPKQLDDGPFQYAHQTKVPFFAWIGENPKYLEAFNNYMGGYRKGKASWMDPGFYPTEQLGLAVKADDVLLVDVGGGLGHDLEELKAKHPQLPGRLVLQDRPEVVRQVQHVSKGIELMEHDFFTEQPIKGAKAYYLHSVLHDWDDESCHKILVQLRGAMRDGHSKLLINENVVPDIGAPWSMTSMDLLMMVLGAARERTQEDWRRLLRSAGFRCVNIWTYEQGTESLIEADGT